jgi:hypothetical protein
MVAVREMAIVMAVVGVNASATQVRLRSGPSWELGSCSLQGKQLEGEILTYSDFVTTT